MNLTYQDKITFYLKQVIINGGLGPASWNALNSSDIPADVFVCKLKIIHKSEGTCFSNIDQESMLKMNREILSDVDWRIKFFLILFNDMKK